MPTSQCPSRDALNPSAWRAYLDTIIDCPVAIGGQPLIDSDLRQLTRWRAGAMPSFWTADAFLIRYRLHIDLFFGFAESLGRSPWAHGAAPPWHEADWSWEDENWTEPDAVGKVTPACATTEVLAA